MSAFERTWYDRFMRNMASLATLKLLVSAGLLGQVMVDGWVVERNDKYGF